MNQTTSRRQAAFTLIELLVVMAIVGLLLSIGVPRYLVSLEKSRDTILKENVRVLRTTLDRFYSDKGRFPDALDELVQQKYLREVPIDPVVESSQRWVLLPSSDRDKSGIADVKSGAPGTAADGTPYASY